MLQGRCECRSQLSEKKVLWSSWLWHLLNTQNVPSSILGKINFSKRKWFSGKIQRCHRWAPGSIPGLRILFCFMNIVLKRIWWVFLILQYNSFQKLVSVCMPVTSKLSYNMVLIVTLIEIGETFSFNGSQIRHFSTVF